MGARLGGTADLPLHSGRAPPWLFPRMRELGGAISELMVDELGPVETIRRISDPFWFQALSCILGFDWHSSGTTTVTLAALREGMSERGLPIHILGGKGKSSTSVPEQLLSLQDRESKIDAEKLTRISRLSARVDTVALQDGFDIYHHSLIIDNTGEWAVVQQGMNGASHYARRYHWLSSDRKQMVVEPHSAILGASSKNVTDFTSKEGSGLRSDIVDVAREKESGWYNGMLLARDEHQSLIDDFTGERRKRLRLDWSANWTLLRRNIERISREQPKDFEELLLVRGIGKKTMLALAMAVNLVYGEEPSWRDPVRYSFAVGGKDGIPYPVDTGRMANMAEIIGQAIESSRVGDHARKRALKALSSFFSKSQKSVFGDS